MITKANTEK